MVLNVVGSSPTRHPRDIEGPSVMTSPLFILKHLRMKHILLPVVSVIAMLAVGSCGFLENKDFVEAEVTFEDINLDENGYIASMPYVYGGGIATFANYYQADFGSYEGFAYSRMNDSDTPGISNQFSVYGNGGCDGSANFAVYYYNTFASQLEGKKVIFSEDIRVNLESVSVTNSTYVALDIQNGSDFSKKFGPGDWFLLTVKATCADGSGKTVEYYLADFRDGKTYICDEWTEVDLSSMTDVLYMDFILTSSDTGEYGMNTPAYFCLDNLKFRYREY